MMSRLFSASHTATVRVWMKCFTLFRRSGWSLTRSRYLGISSMSMRVGCFWRSSVMVLRSGSPSGVSDSLAVMVSPSW